MATPAPRRPTVTPPPATPPDALQTRPFISVIVPTWNERENIEPLLDAIRHANFDAPYEVLIVDDASPDGTGAAVRDAASRNPNVRLLERPGKLGLSSAVMEGAARASGRILVMMDGDLSHDASTLPKLVDEVRAGCDVAIGSRYARGGSLQGWPLHRRIGSLAFTWSARAVFGLRARDPLSGFAAFRRDVLDAQPTRFSAPGFKLLLEVLATQPSLRVVEVPITFVDRCRGTSKLNYRELAALLRLCGRLLTWRAHQGLRRAASRARSSRMRRASRVP